MKSDHLAITPYAGAYRARNDTACRFAMVHWNYQPATPSDQTVFGLP